jgi:hypothetical protein
LWGWGREKAVNGPVSVNIFIFSVLGRVYIGTGFGMDGEFRFGDFRLSAFGTRDGNNIRRITATVIIDAAAAGFWSGLGFPFSLSRRHIWILGLARASFRFWRIGICR